MGRGFAIFALIGMVLALANTLVIVEALGFVMLALVALALGIVTVLQKTQIAYAGGGVVILAGILALLGSFENIGTENGTLDLGITTNVGRAILIIGFVAASATLLAQQWDTMAPDWLRYVAAVGAVGAIGLALFTSDILGDPNRGLNFVTLLMIILAAIPTVTAIRDPQ